MIELNWTLFVQIFNFLLLVYLLNLVLFRPLRQGLKARQAQITSFEGDITQLSESEQGMLAQVQENLSLTVHTDFDDTFRRGVCGKKGPRLKLLCWRR